MTVHEGRYTMRFLNDRKDLESVLRLRFEVFNLELGEGLDSSYETGLDFDDYDPCCHHLVIEDADRNQIVGTYRLQTYEMACAGRGFYSAIEFDFSMIPADVLQKSVELGRACIERSHRNTQVLYLLWRGLAAYASHNHKRYMFGCCSLTSQDPDEGHLIMEQLKRDERLHREIEVRPLPGFECYPAAHKVDIVREVRVPKLFRTYLRFGARVCGAPAIDRQFRTIDYFVVFDIDEMDSHIRRMFFQ